MELDDLARRLEGTGRLLAGMAGRIDHSAPGVRAFGGYGPGQLGALGRALAGQCHDAFDIRRTETARCATMTTDLAEALRLAASGYRDLESRREGGVS